MTELCQPFGHGGREGTEPSIRKLIGGEGHITQRRTLYARHEYERCTDRIKEHVKDGGYGNGGLDGDVLNGERFYVRRVAALFGVEAARETRYARR